MSVNGQKQPVETDITVRLAQLINAQGGELAGSYQRVLREALFDRRTTIRPNMVKQIAADEVDAFASFLHTSNGAISRGEQLHQVGLNDQPLLRMGQVTRQFLVMQLDNGEIAPALKIFDAYQEQLFQGFIQSLEKGVFTVQERTRHAYERVADRNGRK